MQFDTRVALPTRGRATLELFDVSGRRVAHRDLDLGEGRHLASFDATRRLAPGVFVVRLTFEGRTLTTRAVRLR